MKVLARETRQEYGIEGPRVLRSDMKRIFKHQGIHLDYWPGTFKEIRGAYFNDENGATIMVRKDLPPDPCVFTMAHELKHHLADKESGLLACEANPRNEIREIGAEVFAAEFLFPEICFAALMEEMGIGQGQCTAETLVRVKHETKTTMSYAGLRKLAIWLEFATEGSLPKTGWKNLESKIYGVPFYRRNSFRAPVPTEPSHR
jgi:Zn-dependent peptidase ImmA (M78 family)